MKRFNRNFVDPPRDPVNAVVSRVPETKWGLNPLKLMGVFVACLMGLSVLFSVSVILRDPLSDGIWVGAEARVLEVKPQQEEDIMFLVNGVVKNNFYRLDLSMIDNPRIFPIESLLCLLWIKMSAFIIGSSLVEWGALLNELQTPTSQVQLLYDVVPELN
ncbi:hypothetical protein CsSME_00006749 [Camellia sinensis var. sinensis]